MHRQFNGSYVTLGQHNEFEKRQTTICRAMLHQCVDEAYRVRIGDMIIEEEHLKHLDLAWKHSIRHWKKHARNQITRNLPLECREYVLAEKEVHSWGEYGGMYRNSVEPFMERIRRFRKNFTSFYPHFEYVFAEEIRKVTDCALRKKEIVRYLKMYRLCRVSSLTGYSLLMELCTNPPIDCTLTIEVVETLCSNERSRRSAFDYVPDATSLEVLLSHARDMKFDFWGLWSGRGGMSDLLNPIVDYMSSSKNSRARVLLKYGFRYSSRLSVYRKQFFEFLNLGYRNRKIGLHDGLGGMLKTKNPLRLMLTVATFIAFADLEETGDNLDKILTLVQLTRTIPEPYVTPEEMHRELSTALDPFFVDNLEMICNRYESASIYEEDYTILRPRRLTHLCRCKVRDMLADNKKLPEGIQQLGMYERILTYLKLES